MISSRFQGRRCPGRTGDLIDGCRPVAAHERDGSIIVIIATDAPLLSDQCRRLARLATVGLARSVESGTTAQGHISRVRTLATTSCRVPGPLRRVMVPHDMPMAVSQPWADATEEAILNALCAAETMTGYHGRTAFALPLEQMAKLFAVRHLRRLEPGRRQIIDFRPRSTRCRAVPSIPPRMLRLAVSFAGGGSVWMPVPPCPAQPEESRHQRVDPMTIARSATKDRKPVHADRTVRMPCGVVLTAIDGESDVELVRAGVFGLARILLSQGAQQLAAVRSEIELVVCVADQGPAGPGVTARHGESCASQRPQSDRSCPRQGADLIGPGTGSIHDYIA